jgi:septal ring factor EnvC (AmiA/AmiB activator)
MCSQQRFGTCAVPRSALSFVRRYMYVYIHTFIRTCEHMHTHACMLVCGMELTCANRLREEWPAREQELTREIQEAREMQRALEQREEQGRKEVAAVIEAVIERGQVLQQLEDELRQGQDKLAQLEVSV